MLITAPVRPEQQLAFAVCGGEAAREGAPQAELHLCHSPSHRIATGATD
jgi:hypothetical protein